MIKYIRSRRINKTNWKWVQNLTWNVRCSWVISYVASSNHSEWYLCTAVQRIFPTKCTYLSSNTYHYVICQCISNDQWMEPATYRCIYEPVFIVSQNLYLSILFAQIYKSTLEWCGIRCCPTSRWKFLQNAPLDLMLFNSYPSKKCHTPSCWSNRGNIADFWNGPWTFPIPYYRMFPTNVLHTFI